MWIKHHADSFLVIMTLMLLLLLLLLMMMMMMMMTQLVDCATFTSRTSSATPARTGARGSETPVLLRQDRIQRTGPTRSG